MKQVIIDKLEEIQQLAIADDNKALQGLIAAISGAVHANQELKLFIGVSKLIPDLLNEVNDIQAQRN